MYDSPAASAPQTKRRLGTVCGSARERSAMRAQDEQFIKTALDAFQQRRTEQSRCTTLLAIILEYREETSRLSMPRQGWRCRIWNTNHLSIGVEADAYLFWLKEAFVIGASYSKDSDEKEHGPVICDWLSTRASVDARLRPTAVRNKSG